MADYYSPYPDGSLRCKPGNARLPRKCSWHPEHHWCETCEGFYGVPHDNIHEGPSAHPTTNAHQCACRPCVEATARLDEVRR